MLSTLKVTSPRYLSKMIDEVFLEAVELVSTDIQQSVGDTVWGDVQGYQTRGTS